MKHIIAVTVILLITGCSIVYHTDRVTEKEAEIRKLAETINPDAMCPVGAPWFTFSGQQHDDLTLDVLLKLYKTASDKNVRYVAMETLSNQKTAHLIPFWQRILENPDKVDDWTISIAIYGLKTINVPQSNRFLLSLLLEPEMPPTIQTRICFAFQTGADLPKEGMEQMVALTYHTSEKMRLAAFKAIYHTDRLLRTEALWNQLLGRILTDTDLEIVRWGLRSLGENPSPEFFPIILDYLNHADPFIRAHADVALICHYINGAEQFEMCKKALEEKRWSYQTAPLLAWRYAQTLEEERGEFAEAEQAYQAARRAYAPNDASQIYDDDLGVQMLYRIIQVKQKRGDLKGAIVVLNQLVKEYPQDTRVYTDFHQMERTVGELETELRAILEDAPIRIRVLPLNETYQPGQDLKFKVSINNITTEVVMLHCKHQKGGNGLFPDRPAILINGTHRRDFDETRFLVDTVKKVAIPPKGSFAFVGTLNLSLPFRTGNYLINFRFKPVCEFEDGTQWSQTLIAKSVKIKIP